MAVQDALVRSGVVKNRAVEVTELSVERRQSRVDGVAALLEHRQTNVRVLDREQLENPLPQKILIVCGKWLYTSTQIQLSRLRMHQPPFARSALGSALIQNANRSASCISRGWFNCLVTRPNVDCAAVVACVSGGPNCVRLNKLNASARIVKFTWP